MPVTLVFYEEFETRDTAFRAERQIKKWSRKKKIALINRNCESLIQLSKRKNKAEDR
jgi:predicted GIY-YIG superfamily endonuclease